MEMKFSDSRINYSGRIDIKEDGAYFYFASSYARVSFKGTSVSAVINNKTVWGSLCLGYVIDGRMGKIPLDRQNDGRDITLLIADNLEADKIHTLTVYKRHAANHSFALRELCCDGEFTDAPEKPSLRLEFYGDSVSAGEVSEAYDFTGRCDPASHDSSFDNSYLSYTWQTARLLNADIQNVSQGGIAVFDGTGYFHAPKMIGMESIYDKMCYFPEGGEITRWDFSRYIPDIVVFALGQNDKHNGVTGMDDLDIFDPVYRAKWKEGYKNIVCGVHSHYPENTKYVFLTTLLCHDPEWDKAIGEIVSELCGSGINACHMMFKRNGAATPGHPRYQEHKEMAEELAGFIRGHLPDIKK
ncbi:MAG: electron transporter RnfD [Ruminococcus sp.]|nr:electron transporter RnfD [Ruminococcus sp.]